MDFRKIILQHLKKNQQKAKYLDFIYYEGIGKKMLIKLGS